MDIQISTTLAAWRRVINMPVRPDHRPQVVRQAPAQAAWAECAARIQVVTGAHLHHAKPPYVDRGRLLRLQHQDVGAGLCLTVTIPKNRIHWF